jgi:outer membrane lipopolysaccharide assembly protein LptE/RlpB
LAARQKRDPARRCAATVRRTWPAITVLTIALLSLAGCGFQPRGQLSGIAGLPSPIHITGLPAHAPLHHELSRQLEAAGGLPAASAEEAAAVLQISRPRSGSRVLSVDSRNKAVEFELEESVRFQLRPAGGEAGAAQTVRAVRILYQPGDAVLAAEREATVLRAEMHREIASRIVRRLAADR